MVSKGFHLQQIVTELNHKLVTDTPVDRFVAAILIEVNPLRREFSIWNGGMPPAFWINQGEILHEFHSTHMALGIMEKDYFDAAVTMIDLPEQGFLFAYSDGLSEQEDNNETPFSVARIKNLIAQNPPNLIESMTENLKNFSGTDDYCDDVTLCVVEPARVFRDTVEFAERPGLQPDTDTNCFTWEVTLCGRQLEQCDIPPLCNHFLQQIGIQQQSCQKIFSIVAEMVSHAIDHGVLLLDSTIKQNPNGFTDYFLQREQRLKQLTNADFVKVLMQWKVEEGGNYLIVEVADSGKGYQLGGSSLLNPTKFSGRGLELIRRMSDSVEIIAPGNKIRATIK